MHISRSDAAADKLGHNAQLGLRTGIRDPEPEQAGPTETISTQKHKPEVTALVSSAHTFDNHPAPFSRTNISLSKIKEQMNSVYSSLWASLRHAFSMLHYQCCGPAQLVDLPSEYLQRLCTICLGKEWRSTGPDSLTRNSIESLDLFVAVVGAAILADVFQVTPPTAAKIAISFRTPESEKEFLDFFIRQGK